MRATEIIRDLLDIIDAVDTVEQEPTGVEASVTVVEPDVDVNRVKQIAGLLSGDNTAGYANEPEEQVADITAVTTAAGGGMNGPKDPADIRGSTMAMYPGKVYGAQ